MILFSIISNQYFCRFSITSYDLTNRNERIHKIPQIPSLKSCIDNLVDDLKIAEF